MQVEHLLRSALASEDPGAEHLLERLGVEPALVLAQLDAQPADDRDCAGA